MDRGQLMDKYDALKWELAESYGASVGFKGARSVVGLHRHRHDLAAQIAKLREQIIG